MIMPTVGRIVHFRKYIGDEPMAAIICQVFNDRMVNLCVFNESGYPEATASVPLIQDHDEPPVAGYYCEWPVKA